MSNIRTIAICAAKTSLDIFKLFIEDYSPREFKFVLYSDPNELYRDNLVFDAVILGNTFPQTSGTHAANQIRDVYGMRPRIAITTIMPTKEIEGLIETGVINSFHHKEVFTDEAEDNFVTWFNNFISASN